MNTKTKTFRVSEGGALAPSLGRDTVTARNYTAKINWRRVDDAEVPREGYEPFLAPYLPSNIVGLWEFSRPNGDRALVAAAGTSIYRYQSSTNSWGVIGSGYGSSAWEGVSIDGYLILNNGVDLPLKYRVEDSAVSQLREIRDVGIATVGTVAVHNGFLLLGDLTEIQPDQLNTILNGLSPYGLVSSSYTNRVRYKIWWSDYQNPTNFAPVLKGTITSANKDIVQLERVCSAFAIGTKVAVVGAGIDGGILGGTSEYPDGVPVLSVSGAEIQLAAPADNSNTFPLEVQVVRWADTSTFSGYNAVKDDGSAIERMVPLGAHLVVYRSTGIFLGRYTAQVETPFVFTPAYRGALVPYYPQSIVEVDGDSHYYATRNHFVVFDGTGAPRVLPYLDEACGSFLDTAAPSVGAVRGHSIPATREVWFSNGVETLAADLSNRTVSTIDKAFNFVVPASKIYPDGDPRVLHAVDAGVFVYGYRAGAAPLYTRAGSPYTCTIRFGSFFLDPFTPTTLTGYMPQIAAPSPLAAHYRLFGSDSPSGTADLLCSGVIDFPPTTPLEETFFMNTYIHDELSINATAGLKLSGRSFAFLPTRAQGSTRNFNGQP